MLLENIYTIERMITKNYFYDINSTVDISIVGARFTKRHSETHRMKTCLLLHHAGR